MTPSAMPPGRATRAVGAVVDASGRHPLVVLLAAVCVAAIAWHFAFKVLSRPRTDLRELLPTGSPGLQAFEHQLGRVGGGASLIVVVESPEARENERFVDALADRIEASVAANDPALAPLVAYVERGTKDVRRFFDEEKWLYADLHDIEDAYDSLDAQIALRSGLVSDLAGGAAGARPALGLGAYETRWQARTAEMDSFPGGYFEAPGGRMAGLRVVSKTTGMGDAGGDALLGVVRRLAEDTRASIHDSRMKVGFAGDVANAVAEKDSVVGEAAWAGVAAFSLIVVGVVWFYRWPWAPLVIATPAVLGVGGAYAFAYFRFGYVNTTGMFLGAIILGNGINYPIVLLSRYREFVARGRSPADARRDAVQNALRAELSARAWRRSRTGRSPSRSSAGSPSSAGSASSGCCSCGSR